jgi:hypothetical protein
LFAGKIFEGLAGDGVDVNVEGSGEDAETADRGEV